MAYRKLSETSHAWKIPLFSKALNEVIGSSTIGYVLTGCPETEEEFDANFKMIKTPATQNADGTHNDDGVWRVKAEWGFTFDEVKAKFDALISAQPLADLRGERDQRLKDTDWWANDDVAWTDERKTYRQTLRDLPANTSDASNPTWPAKPS